MSDPNRGFAAVVASVQTLQTAMQTGFAREIGAVKATLDEVRKQTDIQTAILKELQDNFKKPVTHKETTTHKPTTHKPPAPKKPPQELIDYKKLTDSVKSAIHDKPIKVALTTFNMIQQELLKYAFGKSQPLLDKGVNQIVSWGAQKIGASIPPALPQPNKPEHTSINEERNINVNIKGGDKLLILLEGLLAIQKRINLINETPIESNVDFKQEWIFYQGLKSIEEKINSINSKEINPKIDIGSIHGLEEAINSIQERVNGFTSQINIFNPEKLIVEFDEAFNLVKERVLEFTTEIDIKTNDTGLKGLIATLIEARKELAKTNQAFSETILTSVNKTQGVQVPTHPDIQIPRHTDIQSFRYPDTQITQPPNLATQAPTAITQVHQQNKLALVQKAALATLGGAVGVALAQGNVELIHAAEAAIQANVHHLIDLITHASSSVEPLQQAINNEATQGIFRHFLSVVNHTKDVAVGGIQHFLQGWLEINKAVPQITPSSLGLGEATAAAGVGGVFGFLGAGRGDKEKQQQPQQPNLITQLDTPINPQVNLDALKELNQELAKKQEHLKATIRLFDENPIVPQVNLEALTNLNQNLARSASTTSTHQATSQSTSAIEPLKSASNKAGNLDVNLNQDGSITVVNRLSAEYQKARERAEKVVAKIQEVPHIEIDNIVKSITINLQGGINAMQKLAASIDARGDVAKGFRQAATNWGIPAVVAYELLVIGAPITDQIAHFFASISTETIQIVLQAIRLGFETMPGSIAGLLSNLAGLASGHIIDVPGLHGIITENINHWVSGNSAAVEVLDLIFKNSHDSINEILAKIASDVGEGQQQEFIKGLQSLVNFLKLGEKNTEEITEIILKGQMVNLLSTPMTFAVKGLTHVSVNSLKESLNDVVAISKKAKESYRLAYKLIQDAETQAELFPEQAALFLREAYILYEQTVEQVNELVIPAISTDVLRPISAFPPKPEAPYSKKQIVQLGRNANLPSVAEALNEQRETFEKFGEIRSGAQPVGKIYRQVQSDLTAEKKAKEKGTEFEPTRNIQAESITDKGKATDQLLQQIQQAPKLLDNVVKEYQAHLKDSTKNPVYDYERVVGIVKELWETTKILAELVKRKNTNGEVLPGLTVDGKQVNIKELNAVLQEKIREVINLERKGSNDKLLGLSMIQLGKLNVPESGLGLLKQVQASQILNSAEFKQGGENLPKAIGQGINAESQIPVTAIENTAEKIIEGFDDTMQIRSPSRVFIERGRRLVEGVVIGIKESARSAQDAIQNILKADQPIARPDILEQTEEALNRYSQVINNPTRIPRITTPQQARPDILEHPEEALNRYSQVVNNPTQAPRPSITANPEQALSRYDNILRSVSEHGERLPGFFNRLNFSVREADATVANAIKRMIKGIGQITEYLFEKFPILKWIDQLLFKIGATIFLEQLIQNLAFQIVGFANSCADAAKEFEALNLAFTSFTGSASTGAKNIETVDNQIKRLGIDLAGAEKAYLALKTTLEYSPLKTQTDSIFGTIAKTAANRSLTSQQQQGFFSELTGLGKNQQITANEIASKLEDSPTLRFKEVTSKALGLNPIQLQSGLGEQKQSSQDALERIVAQYEAANNTVSSESETLEQSLTKVQNSILLLKRGFTDWITGAKPFFDLFSSGLEGIVKIAPNAIFAVTELAAAFLVFKLQTFLDYFGGVIAALSQSKSLFEVLKLAMATTLPEFIAFTPVIIEFLGYFALVIAAVKTFESASDAWKDSTPELTKAIKDQQVGLKSLANAYNEAHAARGNFFKEQTLPKESSSVNDPTGLNLFGIQTPLSLEPFRYAFGGISNFIRKPLGLGEGAGTLGEKQSSDFQEATSKLLANVDRNLIQSNQLDKDFAKVGELDQKINAVRSQRNNLRATDTEGFNKSIDAETKLIEERRKLIAETAQATENLDADKKRVQTELKTLEEQAANRQISEGDYTTTKASLESRLKDIDKTQVKFEGLTNSLQKQLSSLAYAFDKLNSSIAFDNQKLEERAARARLNLTVQGQKTGEGVEVTSKKQEQLSLDTSEEKLNILEKHLSSTLSLLNSPLFSKIIQTYKGIAASQGESLNNLAYVEKLIAKAQTEDDKKALELQKSVIESRKQILANQEEVTKARISTHNGFIELGKSVYDWFKNVTEGNKRLTLEVQGLAQELEYWRITTALEDSLGKVKKAVKGITKIIRVDKSFEQGLNSFIQESLNQASAISEKLLHQQRLALGLEEEKYSVKQEIVNFSKNLAGGSYAVKAFVDALNNGSKALLDKGDKPLLSNTTKAPLNNASKPVATNSGKLLQKKGKVSFYGDPADGEHDEEKPTASGEKFNHNALTAASPYIPGTTKPAIPFGTYVLVTNLENGKQVVVRITDTGKFGDAKYGNRALDLSKGAFKKIADPAKGVVDASLQIVDKSGKPAKDVADAASLLNKKQALNQRKYNLENEKIDEEVARYKRKLQTKLEEENDKVDNDILKKELQLENEKTLKEIEALKRKYSYETEDVKYKVEKEELEKTFNTKKDEFSTQVADLQGRIDSIKKLTEEYNKKIPDLDKIIAKTGQPRKVVEIAKAEKDFLGQYIKNLQVSQKSYEAQLEQLQRVVGDRFEGTITVPDNQKEFQFLKPLQVQARQVQKTIENAIAAGKGAISKLPKNIKIKFTADIESLQKNAKEAIEAGGRILVSPLDRVKSGALSYVDKQHEIRLAERDLENVQKEIDVASIGNSPKDLALKNQLELLKLEKTYQLTVKQTQLKYGDEPEELQKRLDLLEKEYNAKKRELELNLQINQVESELNNIRTKLSIAQDKKDIALTEELKKLEIQKQLEKDILDIKQKYPNDAEDQAKRIGLLTQKADLDNRQIGFNSVNARLALQEKEASLKKQLEDLQANSLEQQQGVPFDANQIRKQSAIEQENLRYKQQTTQLSQDYVEDPSKLKTLLSEAQQIHELNLQNVNNQFKDLGQTIKDEVNTNLDNFINQLATGQISLAHLGEAFKQLAADILKGLAQIAAKLLQNQLAEFLGLKPPTSNTTTAGSNGGISIDWSKFFNNGNNSFGVPTNGPKLNTGFTQGTTPSLSQFGGFSGFDFGSLAGNLTSSLATDAATSLATDVAASASESLFADLATSLVAALYAGGEVGKRIQNFAKGGPIAKAFALERSQSGKNPRLVVAHDGEHILSTRNGEAQKYRELEKRLGTNPLQRFATGGPVSADSLLYGLSNRNSNFIPNYAQQLTNDSSTNNTHNITIQNNYHAPTDRFNRQDSTLAREQVTQLRRAIS